MKYVEWVEAVLRATVQAKTGPGAGSMIGVREVASELGYSDWEEISGPLITALRDLQRMGLVDLESQWRVEISQEARKITVASLASSWKTIHGIWLDEEQVAFLRAVVELSERPGDGIADVEFVFAPEAFERLGWELDHDHINLLVQPLGEAGLLDTSHITMGPTWKLLPTYVGVVRATEAETSELVDLVRRLLPDWETTNVDFKRELHLETRDEKAEFVRDVLALATTRVTGERYLVIGWDPTSHEFTTPVDARVTQERIEDVLGHYTAPTVIARLRTFDWLGGDTAAVIEVHRDRTHVPYRVKQDLSGAKRKITTGEIYVRHGSHIALANPEEIADLEAEATFAKSR